MSIKEIKDVNIKDKKLVLIILSIAILSVSTAAIFIRFAQETIPSIAIASYRLIIASLILFPFTIKKAHKEMKDLNSRSIGLVIISGLLLAVHFASWIISLEFTNVISSVVLVTTTPIWVTAISPWLIKEKVPKRFLLGLALAFLGMVLISFSNSGFISSWQMNEIFIKDELIIQGNLLALLGALCAAGYVVIGRILRKQLSTGSYALSVYSIAGAVLVVFAVVSKEQSMRINLYELKWLVLIALIPQVIGHSLINWSLGIMPAYLVAISLLGEPIGSTILAIFFLKEIPTIGEIISAVIILLGIFIAIIGSKNLSDQGRKSIQA
jgi:drug/metabolite transporter (DMT)-like permease